MLALAIAFALSCAQAVPPSEAELVDGVAQLQAKLDAQDWKSAAARANELLAAHGAQPYVHLHLPELREALHLAEFYTSYQPPATKALIAGELVSYSESTGAIKLRYAKADVLTSFRAPWLEAEASTSTTTREPDESDLVWRHHPASFAGPYSIEFSGVSYTPGDLRNTPRVLFVFDDGQYAQLIVGGTETGERGPSQWSRAVVSTYDGGGWKVADERAQSPCLFGAKFSIKISVSETRITAAYNGKVFLSAAKPPQKFGQFALAGFGCVRDYQVQGRVEPAWIRDLRDQHVDLAWNSSRAVLAPDAVLPAPLRPARFESSGFPNGVAFPDPVEANVAKLIEAFTRALDAEKLPAEDELRRELTALRAEGLSAANDAWLVTLIELAYGRRQFVAENCEATIAESPRYAPAFRLRGQSEWALRRLDDAEASFRAALALTPEDDDLALDLADLLWARSKLAELEQLLRSRAEANRYNRKLDALNALRLRALSGPRWPQTFVFETEHYTVKTDIDLKTCREAAQMLENSLDRFEARLAPLPSGESQRFPVYLFSGRGGYQRYMAEAMSERLENTAGLYHRGLRQLLIWNLPRRSEMMQTVRHEALHQYLDRVAPDSPTWLNEGLAEYYENAEFQRGPSSEIRPHANYLMTLRAGVASRANFEQVLRISPGDYYANAQLTYPIAWSMVHFLLSGEREHRALFDVLFTRLAAGASAEAALDAALEGVDLNELAAAWLAHVSALHEELAK